MILYIAYLEMLHLYSVQAHGIYDMCLDAFLNLDFNMNKAVPEIKKATACSFNSFSKLYS